MAPPGPAPGTMCAMTSTPPSRPRAERTAHRLEWPFLPPHVRTLVEERCGSAVEHAESATAGFTPGFASVLTCADGSKHFVKAASVKAQRAIAASYREEARKLGALPPSVRAPRLLWSHDDDDWVVLGIEYVEGSNPSRPWRQTDLDACLDAIEMATAALTPPPAGLALGSFADEFAALPSYWQELRDTAPSLPGFAEHADGAARLAEGFAEVTAGDSVVHTDLRADNFLLDPTGRAWICDWNWPVRGAAWIDTVLLLLGPREDGLDVESTLRSRALTRDVPAPHVDAVLALVTGYYLRQRLLPPQPGSPHLRDFQSRLGEAGWGWLGQRRGWS